MLISWQLPPTLTLHPQGGRGLLKEAQADNIKKTGGLCNIPLQKHIYFLINSSSIILFPL
jgi:hypothetical protein